MPQIDKPSQTPSHVSKSLQYASSFRVYHGFQKQHLVQKSSTHCHKRAVLHLPVYQANSMEGKQTPLLGEVDPVS